MKKINRLRFSEFVLISFVWLVLITAPFLFRDDKFLAWQDLVGPMQTIIPLFIIFLLNRFILVPKLLFKNKNLSYIISVVSLIAVFTLGSFLFPGRQFENRQQDELNSQWRPPPPHERTGNRFPPPEDQGRRGPMPHFVNLLIFSFLMVGFDTGLMNTFRLAKSERKREKLEKENVGTQLAFLRNQVSPHFFMNTLNNIHSLIDIDKEEAKESIIRLSKLMRHLLYDSEIEKIPLNKEIGFIKNYVDLMKLRFSDKVRIKLNLPAQLPDKSIPPLLFTSFVENAFKHGVSYQNTTYIDISFTFMADNLIFEVKNSNPNTEKNNEASGIGIENSRKRLDLIYGDQYSLKIEDLKNEHHVRLSIPI